MNLTSSFYQGNLVGTTNQNGKVQCFGWCVDPDANLIALSIQGGSTAVKAIQAAIQSDQNITLNIKDQNWNTRYGTTKTHRYDIFVSHIPDSNYLSLIALAKTLTGREKSDRCLHLPYFDDDDLAHRFNLALKDFCHMPILPEWSEYLIRIGKTNNERLIGKIPTPDTAHHWLSNGFNIYWLRPYRERWEYIIQEGIRNKHINIGV